MRDLGVLLTELYLLLPPGPSVAGILSRASGLKDILSGLQSSVSLLHVGFFRVIYKQKKLK